MGYGNNRFYFYRALRLGIHPVFLWGENSKTEYFCQHLLSYGLTSTGSLCMGMIHLLWNIVDTYT